jgi:hypothetical protein
VTAHPTAACTLQQLRAAILSDDTYRFILHDPDAIFSPGFDASLAHLDLEIIGPSRCAPALPRADAAPASGIASIGPAAWWHTTPF